jgi:unsaturated rhamnogalacturonyl hydrolase
MFSLRSGLAVLAGVLISTATIAASAQVPTLDEVKQVIRKANNRWQETNPVHGNAFWNRAVYHVGNMDAYEITREPSYLLYSDAWSRQNLWEGARSDDPAEWLYSYGETDRYVLFGDWQVCFQVYMKLHALAPAAEKIARTQEVMAYQITTPQNDYLWWSDGLFMVMPVMTRLHHITGDGLLLEKLRDYFDYARDLMYDAEAGLFFRDAKYVYPGHTTTNGIKDFWARGNGWVFAALPRVLDDLPEDHPDRAHYLDIFRSMADSLAASQQEDGYWTRSILDPAHAPGPESSGTAFFTYGYLWGLRNQVLDAAEYGPVALKGWDFLTRTALQANGTVGFIQPIGERAIPGQVVDSSSTADFGVGAFLMAAAEMARYAETVWPVSADAGPHQVRFDADGDYAETVRLDASHTVILDGGTAEFTWWRGDVFLAEGIQPDVMLPLGDHDITLKVRHADEEPYTSITRVRVQPKSPVQLAVSASGFEPGNPPAHVLDGNPSTRWSHQGAGQWVQLEFPETLLIDRALISFHLGNQRFTYFDLAVSPDGSTWEQVFTGQSSGMGTGFETFTFPARNSRYLRYIGRGNSINDWNSVTGFMLPLVPVASASGFQQGNPPANALDGSLSTRWSHEGIGQWLQLELPQALTLDHVRIAFLQGDSRFSYFDIAVSLDGSAWEQVFSGQSSGTTNELETFVFPSRSVRYLRYIGRGNSTSNWNSVTEIRLPIAEALDTADRDTNGLPDAWEIHHFGSVGQDPALRSHFLTGVAPDAPQGPPALRIEPTAAPPSLRLVLDARAAFGPGYLGKDRNHRILTSPDLSDGSWLPLHGDDLITGDNLSHSIEIIPTRAPAFYRAAIQLEESDP